MSKFMDLLNKLAGLNESANPNSPENRVLEFCVRTDHEDRADYWSDSRDDSDLDEVLLIIKWIQKDVEAKKISEPFEDNYLISEYKDYCRKIVKSYNMLQYKRDDNEEKPKNFSKVTLTKKFIVDFCNLVWEKRDYLKKIKK